MTLHLNEWQGEPAFQLRGMAVDPSLQRSGIGERLLQAADRLSRALVADHNAARHEAVMRGFRRG